MNVLHDRVAGLDMAHGVGEQLRSLRLGEARHPALQFEQLLAWLTSQPPQLTPAQVHEMGSTLDAALPPRDDSGRPLILPDNDDPGARKTPVGSHSPVGAGARAVERIVLVLAPARSRPGL